jgi:hypothetical protein
MQSKKTRKQLINEIDNVKMCVFGSRTLSDERVKVAILEAMEKYGVTKILTCQEPEGVSEMAQRVAKETATPLQVHFLNFRFLRGAFEHRSKEAVKNADVFLIIHDGESKGTLNEKILVEKSGKPFDYVVLEKTEYKRSVGFNIKKDWGGDDKQQKNALSDLMKSV